MKERTKLVDSLVKERTKRVDSPVKEAPLSCVEKSIFYQKVVFSKKSRIFLNFAFDKT